MAIRTVCDIFYYSVDTFRKPEHLKYKKDGTWRVISSEEFRIPLVIDSGTYTLASLVMLGAGLVTAFIVRRRIDQLDLIGVLKTRD